MRTSEIIKRLLNLIASYRLWLLGSILLAIVSVILNLYAPLFVGDIIDAIASRHESTIIFKRLGMLAGLYLAYSLTTWGLMLCTNKIAYASSCTLRKQLFEKMEKLPVSFYDTHEHGDVLSRFTNDIDMISDGLLQGISTLLNGIVTVFLAILFMARINLIMTFIVMLCAPFTFFVARTITKRSHKYFIAQTNDLGHVNGFTQEMLSGIKTLKAYGHEEAALQTFEARNETLYDSGKNSQFYGSLANPSTRLVTNAAYTIVGVSGAILSILDLITIGNISSFLIYSNVFSKPFNEISGVVTQLQSASASAVRIFTLFDLKEEENQPSQTQISGEGHIQFTHVDFAYDKNQPLIQDLTIDIPQGSRVAIVGKTGAGKTTFVNLLMRFYEIDHGSIYIDGVNIQHISRDDLRRHFGMVLQDTYLFEDTIHNNITYGKKDASREDVINAARKSGADAFISRLPQGYDTILTSNSSYLSQGQRQLLSITRVMLMDPAILILDEATSNIDTRSEQHVTQAMELLMKGKTSFVIAHRLSTIVHSDTILVMDKGNIIEQGNHEELLQKQGAYYELYNSQFTRT